MVWKVYGIYIRDKKMYLHHVFGIEFEKITLQYLKKKKMTALEICTVHLFLFVNFIYKSRKGTSAFLSWVII